MRLGGVGGWNWRERLTRVDGGIPLVELGRADAIFGFDLLARVTGRDEIEVITISREAGLGRRMCGRSRLRCSCCLHGGSGGRRDLSRRSRRLDRGSRARDLRGGRRGGSARRRRDSADDTVALACY